jgi:hypothetical protein
VNGIVTGRVVEEFPSLEFSEVWLSIVKHYPPFMGLLPGVTAESDWAQGQNSKLKLLVF